MYTRTTILSLHTEPLLPAGVSPDQVLFFDIETSGFSADVTTLYLIGCVRFLDGAWTLTQWFADDNHSEPDILTAFFELAAQYSCIIHYNGTGFDLPYLAKRCGKYQFDYSIPEEKSCDIYKLLQPLRHLLPTENLKQKSVERYLEIVRKDRYDGGELIKFYAAYIKAKYGHQPEEKELLETLLLHNAEDLTGLLQITALLAIPAIAEGCRAEEALLSPEHSTLIINIKLPEKLPEPIQLEYDNILFSAHDICAQLQIPLYQGELKYFYSNYKDYYYLPAEDMAVHKSVATYVDKDFRVKAKAATCYIRRNGIFVPQYQPVLEPYFKMDFTDKIFWVEVTDNFCQNNEALTKYARQLIQYLMTGKKKPV